MHRLPEGPGRDVIACRKGPCDPDDHGLLPQQLSVLTPLPLLFSRRVDVSQFCNADLAFKLRGPGGECVGLSEVPTPGGFPRLMELPPLSVKWGFLSEGREASCALCWRMTICFVGAEEAYW